MQSGSTAQVMRIYISNTDKFKHVPLYEALIFAAKRYGMAGATAHKGIMGFGSSSVIYSTKFWTVSDKLPMIVEVIDEETNIKKFADQILPWFDKLRYGCLVTVENINVILYKHGKLKN